MSQKVSLFVPTGIADVSSARSLRVVRVEADGDVRDPSEGFLLTKPSLVRYGDLPVNRGRYPIMIRTTCYIFS